MRGGRATRNGTLDERTREDRASEKKPRLHAVGKVPTVAAMGSRAPTGAATKHTEQSAHQAAIWVALEYAGQCLSKGSKVTLTVESATALRNLHDAPADEGARPGAAAQGGVAAQTPHRDGAARPMPGNGNKRQRPNPRPDLKRGREAEERAVRRAARPSHTEMNTRSKRRLEALSRRYPGKLELRAPQGATPVTLRMQALTAARFDDILAHVTFTGTGSKDSRLYPLWDQTRIWDPGD